MDINIERCDRPPILRDFLRVNVEDDSTKAEAKQCWELTAEQTQLRHEMIICAHLYSYYSTITGQSIVVINKYHISVVARLLE